MNATNDTRDDTNDLRSLLGEKAADSTTGLAHGEIGQQVPDSETVLQLDRWGQNRGADLAREWAEADAGQVEAPIAADAHGALFEAAPVQAARPADAKRAAWFKQLMESPEYRNLHNQTMLDSDMSALAAKGICDEFSKYIQESPPESEDAPAPGSDGESIQSQLARIRSTGKALAAAQQDVSDVRDTAAGLGLQKSDGKIDAKALAQAFKRVRNSDLLRKVLQLAGRMICRCRSLQRQKLTAKRGEITGIELGGDIARLIPRERLSMTGCLGPELQERAEYRLLKRRALCYKQKLSTPVSSGPICISIDESGSMSGDKIVAAKAVAVTLAWLATQQNRWVALVAFGADADGRALVLPPGHKSHAELIEWIETFWDASGTVLDCPCGTVPQTLWPQWLTQGLKSGKTDHIIITDGCMDCPQPLHDSYVAFANAEKVKTYGIVIGETEAGGIETVCDRCWCLPDLTLDAAAVEEVLSI